jgi:hypothetical protein
MTEHELVLKGKIVGYFSGEVPRFGEQITWSIECVMYNFYISHIRWTSGCGNRLRAIVEIELIEK